METNYNYYPIDTADIWEFEQRFFLNGKSSETHAAELLEKIRLEITKHKKPLFGITDFHEGDEQYRDYYTNVV